MFYFGVLMAVMLQAEIGLADDKVVSPSGTSQFEMLTGDEAHSQQVYWDQKFDTPQYVYGREPSSFLKSVVSQFSDRGKVLDLAMGEGRNAVYLAKRGFDVLGVDLSSVALRKAKRLAREMKVKIRVEQADLNQYSIPPGGYDVVLLIEFYLPSLWPKILKGVRSGGWLVFESATRDSTHPEVKASPNSFPEAEKILNTLQGSWVVFKKNVRVDGGWKILEVAAQKR